MRRLRLVAAITATLLIFSAWPSSLAKPPSVTSLFPAGAKQGSTVEVTVADAPEHWPSEAWTSHVGIKFDPIKDKKGAYKTTITADTPVGPHLVRFFNTDGSAQPRIFFVGLADETPEV